MIDDQAATELELYINNTAELYPQLSSIHKNLATKKARKQYKHDLAVKAFGYVVEAGAKRYVQEFGGVWHQMFPVPTRKAVAEELARTFESEEALGNYRHLLPKKYQTAEKPSKSAKSAHATKKVSWKTPESIKVQWSPVNAAWFALWPGRGSLRDQQVLKIAGTDEMDSWLRETYGDQYGRAGRASGRAHATRRAHDQLHERGALRSATDRQLRSFYRDEKRDAEKARAEAARRGLSLHAHRRSPSQLDREIAEHVPSWRRGR